MSQTVSFTGKEIQVLSTHAFMFPKVLADDFEAEELCKSATSRIVSFCFERERGNSRMTFLSQYHRANTLTHKPLLHLKEKTLREQKQTGEGERTEEEDGRAQMKSSGGAQFTEAALNQPITVKENISWCVSFPREEERMKGEEGKCI